MQINYENKELTQRYQLMAQTIIPRPIAWIVTEQNGVVNIAPFSYFMGLSSDPATMIVSIGHKSDGSEKDTLKNIRESGKCTICMVDEPLLEKMHFSPKELGSEVSESELYEIQTQRVVDGYPPMVSGVPSAFFCDFHQEIELKGSQTIPLIVAIKEQYISDAIISDTQRIAIDYEPVARVGKSYALLGKKIAAPEIC